MSLHDVIDVDGDKEGPKRTELSRLNTDILLHILSYTDPHTVCSFSRTSYWRNKFVDCNITRLPRIELTYGRIIITPASVTYHLAVLPNFKLHLETRDTYVNFPCVKYVLPRNLSIVFNSIEPRAFRGTVETILDAGGTLDLVRWNHNSGSFCTVNSDFNTDASYVGYLRRLFALDLEAIFDRAGFAEWSCKIQSIAVAAFQNSFYSELDLSNEWRAAEECFLLLAKILKDILEVKAIRAKQMMRGFSKIILLSDVGSYPPDVREENTLLLYYLKNIGLPSSCGIESQMFPAACLLEISNLEEKVAVKVLISHEADTRGKKLVVRLRGNQFNILESLRRHKHRPAVLQAVADELSDLPSIFPNDFDLCETIEVLLYAIHNYPDDQALQLGSSTAVAKIAYYVSLYDDRIPAITADLLLAAEAYIERKILIDNCLLSLNHLCRARFLAPLWKRCGRIVGAVTKKYIKEKSGAMAVQVLYNMSLNRSLRDQFADTGAIEAVLSMMDLKQESGVCDSILEMGWNFLLSVTDMVPENGKRFLEGGGVGIFLKSYMQFKCQTCMAIDLPLNMITTISNISEFKTLRRQLMSEECVRFFSALSTANDESRQRRYIAAAILVRLVGEGDEAWTNLTLNRQAAMEKITEAITTWDISAKQISVSNSVTRLLEFIPMFDSPACQHWALWILANMTSVNGDVDILRLLAAGGLTLLESVRNDSRLNDTVKNLISVIFKNAEEWKKGGHFEWEICCRRSRRLGNAA